MLLVIKLMREELVRFVLDHSNVTLPVSFTVQVNTTPVPSWFSATCTVGGVTGRRKGKIPV